MASQNILCSDWSFNQKHSGQCDSSPTTSYRYMTSDQPESCNASISLDTNSAETLSCSEVAFLPQNQVHELRPTSEALSTNDLNTHSNCSFSFVGTLMHNKNFVDTSALPIKHIHLPSVENGQESFHVDLNSCKNQADEQCNKSYRVPLDTGLQCWIIVISCSFINALLFGIYRSYALIYPKLIDQYELSRGDATWPFSLCMTMVHLSGPLSSGLNRWLSTRSIYLLGCALSTGSLVACKYWPDISGLIIQIGLVQGQFDVKLLFFTSFVNVFLLICLLIQFLMMQVMRFERKLA